MPILNKNYTLEITPEQFLNACSSNELIETGLLLDRPYYQQKIVSVDDTDSMLKTLKTLISETSGAGFYMYTNGHCWTIAISKTDYRMHGTLEDILKKTIAEITENRTLRKTTNKTSKKYIYL